MTEKYSNLLNILYGPASGERSANYLEKGKEKKVEEFLNRP